jgi:hypothetical protein
MTLDKHQIDGIGGFCEQVLPTSQFEELIAQMISTWDRELYIKACRFAAQAHRGPDFSR